MEKQILSQTYTSSSVLVTGATGFIGSHLVKKLIDLNSRVTIIARPGTSFWRLDGIKKQLRMIEVDLRYRKQLHKLLIKKHFQFIFHLAAETDHDRDQKLIHKTFSHNISTTLNLVNFFLNSSIKAFVQVGTCEEYGTNKAPFHEELREQPVSPYSASKVAITHYLQMFYRIFGFPSVTVRPFLTYGPGQDMNYMIPYCISRALQNAPLHTTRGEQTREFHYVSDIVIGLLRAGITPKALGQVIDLGTSREHVIKDVIKLIMKLTHSSSQWYTDIPYRPGETMRFYCRGEKARKLLGWYPKVTLKKGLSETIAWYRAYLQKVHE